MCTHTKNFCAVLYEDNLIIYVHYYRLTWKTPSITQSSVELLTGDIPPKKYHNLRLETF